MNNVKYLEIPKECPICKGLTEIAQTNQAKVLYCTDEDCAAKHIGNLVHFTKRDAMNIEGLSESTLERFVKEGFIQNYKDIYYLKDYEDNIVRLEGFGQRSFDNIINAVEKSREVDLANFLYSLGVVQLGRSTSKLVCDALGNNLEIIINVTEDELLKIDGIGHITAREIVKYFDKNAEMVKKLAKEMRFKEVKKVDKSSGIAGKNFVVTGSVNHFKNRKELQLKIEELGGKVVGSVSTKTDYLINNDVNSTSSKNKKAKEIGVTIISEEEFLEMIG